MKKVYIDKYIEVIEARLDGMDRAAVLKANEIDRRLEEHNKLREEVLTDRSQFMRTEVYAADRKTWQQWKESVNASVTKLMTKYDSRMTMANWISIVAVVVTFINLVVLAFLRFSG
jgi:hypothetical protein